jgi:hypothetical protein
MNIASSPIVDAAQLSGVLGGYRVGNSRALGDPFLAMKAQGYRRNLAARMRALDRQGASDALGECEGFVSRKVDGEFTVLLIENGQCCSVNPGGVVRTGLPFMHEAAELVGKSKYTQVLLAGELFVAKQGSRERVHDVSNIARQPKSQSDLDALHMAVFDLIELNGKPAPAAATTTFKQINAIFGNGVRIRPVEARTVKSAAEIMKAFEEWVEGQGAEGLVVRSDSAGLYKIKRRVTVDAAVLGFTEGTNGRTGMLHDMLLGLMRPDETFHVMGRVGTGMTEDQRRDWLSDLKDMVAESDYAEVNDSVAYQMVRPEWVVEVSVLDFITHTTRGGGIDRMVLDFDRQSGGYKSLRRLPLASPISPVLVRRREDKAVRADDLRLAQISDVIEVPMADANAKQARPATSEILRREAFTKTLKGALMVRKLVMFATNKHRGENPAHPAFVVCFTDFSPNRATPLERDIRVSNSREQIQALYEELKQENIVKGWSLVGG